MPRPAQPRKVCAHCRVRYVKKAGRIFCSMECRSAAKARPFHRCPACRVQHQRVGVACSRSCAARIQWARRDRGEFNQRAADGRRTAFVDRMVVKFKATLAELDAALTPGARAAVLARVYQHGRHDQRALDYYRTTAKERAS